MKIKEFIPACVLILMTTLLIPTGVNSQQIMKIAVSKASPNYINWLKKGNSAIETLNMYELTVSQAEAQLDQCAGLLVTGGEDINPGLYGQPGEMPRCIDVDIHRDSLEQVLIRLAIVRKMPIVGICRGEQMINVALGGTLYIDLPADFRFEQGNHDTTVHHQCPDYLKCYHKVTAEKNTLLASIAGSGEGFVTSNHHQAVHKVAPGLRVNAKSPDGLVEGIEWKNPEGKSFLVGVQWHPERMDISNTYSGNLLHEFIHQAENYLKTKEGTKK